MSKIKGIQVFGERNSGTNYLRKLLRDNCPDIRPLAGDNGFGWKHDDLGNPFCYYKEDGKYFCHTIRDYKTDSDKVLFLVIYRDPFTWLQSMHKQPHHAPEVYGLAFSKFIRHRFRTYWGPWGHDLDPNPAKRQAMVKADNLVEEYDNPMKLRTGKIAKFESFPKKVKYVCYLRLEDLKKDPVGIVKTIAKQYDIKTKQTIANVKEDKFGKGRWRPKKYGRIKRRDYNYVVKELNWDLEGKVGYSIDSKPKGLGMIEPRQNLAISNDPLIRFFKDGKKI